MTFAHPRLLWALAIGLPAVALFLWWSWRERRRLIGLFVPQRLQDALTIGLSPRRARLRGLLLVLGLGVLVVALARPRYGIGTVEVTQRGLDILVAIDTSRSMLAEDAGPGLSRLRRAKLAALDLARLAKTDRVGLIAFAGTAFLQCPLTIDDEAFRQSVELLDIGIIPQGGTSLAAAIRTAIAAFQSHPEGIRALVLITDGEDHEAGVAEATREAAADQVRVFTVGVGTSRGEIIRLLAPDGTESYLKDADGNVVKSSLNEPLLREIAAATGGLYLPMQGPRAMAELFARGLEPLPRVEMATRSIEEFHERFQWPLALALLLLAIEAVLPERRARPGTARPVRLSHPSLAQVGGMMVAFLLPLATIASPRSAMKDFREGRFQEAESEFDRLARERPDDARLRFNAGTAAYRAEDYERAMSHFAEALRSSDLQLQRNAFYNLGNTQFSLGERVPEEELRQRLWREAIRSFEAALKLAPDTEDARHNLEYVRQRLEELEQQQQQQPEPSQEPSDPSEDSEEPQPSPSNPPEKPDPSEPDEDRSRPEESAGDSSESDSESEDQGSPGETGESSPEDGAGEQGESPADTRSPSDPGEPGSPDQMTPEQAMRLLDAARGDEQPMPLDRPRGRERIWKDW